jgi:hypothetical protein
MSEDSKYGACLYLLLASMSVNLGFLFAIEGGAKVGFITGALAFFFSAGVPTLVSCIQNKKDFGKWWV